MPVGRIDEAIRLLLMGWDCFGETLATTEIYTHLDL